MFSLQKKNETRPDPAVATAEPRRVVRPRTDIHEEPEAVVLTMDVPGCNDKAVAITAEEGVLTVRATPRAETPAGFQPLWREREDRVYERSFTLPDAVDVAGASAQVKHGVLTLRLPKAQEARPRRINVTAA
jgi:HSP20 family molecular chaperone IbpA